jgi:hypothetical protein
LRLISAAFNIDRSFGLLVAVIAAVGARLSQVARLRVIDLEANRPDCRVQMPCSKKGRTRKMMHAPVPIPRWLADLLVRECEGRGPEEPLLRRADGAPWPFGYRARHQDLLRAAAGGAKLDPTLTLYWLRHSSIKRSLLAGTPIAITAKLHDTSVKMVEAHYGRFVLDLADQIVRPRLLDMPLEVPRLPAPSAGVDDDRQSDE